MANITLDAYKERCSFIWNSYFKMKKFSMLTTGSPLFDIEIMKMCGTWHHNWKKMILQLREKQAKESDINTLIKFIEENFFYYLG